MKKHNTTGLLWGVLCLVPWLAAASIPEAVWSTNTKDGEKAYKQGNYAEAEQRFVAALKEAESFGPQDQRLASSLSNLARVYRVQDRYAEAEPLNKRALTIWETVLGTEHPTVAGALNNLALLYDDQGRYAEAEPLWQRALAIKEKTLGPEHPQMATVLNNVAQHYDAQKRYAEAEPLLQRALAIREKALGPEHPQVATTLNNLAQLYEAQGRYTDAEPLLKRALAINEKALGPEHPDVAMNLNNLGMLYNSQKKYAEAEPLLRRSLAIAEKTWGPEHPEVAASLNNLAIVLRNEGRKEEAGKLEARSKSITDSPRLSPEEVAKPPVAPMEVAKAAPQEAAKRELLDAYFAFDKWSLSLEGKKNLNQSVEVLKQNPEAKVLIEGHCDERGTHKYNLVLGEKRAQETRLYLESQGVKNHVAVASYGEKRPVCAEHDESCYWKNRRAHLVLQSR